MGEQRQVFISYARGDDEDFVKNLYRDLVEDGIDVWWDREAMENRGRTFLQEIRDAIDGVERLVLVVGPEAARSKYVQAEWSFALAICKTIVPVLRLGDYSLVPKALRQQHTIDFRPDSEQKKALKQLRRILKSPVVPLGTLHGVIALPAHYLPRLKQVDDLQKLVLADAREPTVITSARQTTALQGMGGVGKSVLASAFARSCAARQAFGDGIVWLEIGQQPKKAAVLRRVGSALGDDLQFYLDPDAAESRLANLLQDKSCLLVLDDVWDVTDADSVVNALGPRCRALVTTRDGRLIESLGAQHYGLDVLDEKAALKLLAKWSSHQAGDLPQEARQVAEQCGYLPLALAMTGAMVGGRADRWIVVLDRLQNADLDRIRRQFPNYPYPDLLRAIQVSVDTLEPDSRRRYLELAVFQPDTPVPEGAVITLWLGGGLAKSEALDEIDRLVSRSLAQRDEDGRLLLHDLQYDYVRRQQPDLTALHERLLAGYGTQCPNGWASGPDDGYFFQHLDQHLIAAGRTNELRRLLLDYRWLEAKLKVSVLNDLLDDYDAFGDDKVLAQVRSALAVSAPVLVRSKSALRSQLYGRLMGMKQSELQAMAEKVRLSPGGPWLRPLSQSLPPPGGPLLRTLLLDDENNLTGIAASADGHDENNLTGIAASADGHSVFISKYGGIERWDPYSGEILNESVFSVGYAGMMTPLDNTRLLIGVSLINNSEIRVIDIAKGEVVGLIKLTEKKAAGKVKADNSDTMKSLLSRQLSIGKMKKQSKGAVSLAAAWGGRYIVAAMDDGTIQVWDATKFECLHVLENHQNSFYQVAAPAERQWIVATAGSSLKVWNLKSGKLVRQIHHNELLHSIAVTADGRRVVAGSLAGGLVVWDPQEGGTSFKIRSSPSIAQRILGLLELDDTEDILLCLAVTNDGHYAVTGHADGRIRIWDLEKRHLAFKTQALGSEINDIITAYNDRLIVSREHSGVHVWDLSAMLAFGDAGLRAPKDKGHEFEVVAVSATADSRQAVTANDEGSIIRWDLNTGRVRQRIKLGSPIELEGIISVFLEGIISVFFDYDTGWVDVSVMAVSAEGRMVVATDGSKKLTIWDLKRGEKIGKLKGHKSYTEVVAITPDGRLAVSGGYDRRVRVWDLRQQRQIQVLKGHDDTVVSVAISADGQIVASVSDDESIKVWKVKTSQCIHTFTLENGMKYKHGDPEEVALAANGRFVVVATEKYLISWATTSGKKRFALKLRPKGALIGALAVTREGQLAAVTLDNCLQLWDLDQEELLTSFYGGDDIVSCTFTPDSQTIIAGEESGTVHLLRLEGWP